MNKSLSLCLYLFLIFIVSCNDDESDGAKTLRGQNSTFLKIEFPDHNYHLEEGAAPFKLKISDISTLKLHLHP